MELCHLMAPKNVVIPLFIVEKFILCGKIWSYIDKRKGGSHKSCFSRFFLGILF